MLLSRASRLPAVPMSSLALCPPTPRVDTEQLVRLLRSSLLASYLEKPEPTLLGFIGASFNRTNWDHHRPDIPTGNLHVDPTFPFPNLPSRDAFSF